MAAGGRAAGGRGGGGARRAVAAAAAVAALALCLVAAVGLASGRGAARRPVLAQVGADGSRAPQARACALRCVGDSPGACGAR